MAGRDENPSSENDDTESTPFSVTWTEEIARSILKQHSPGRSFVALYESEECKMYVLTKDTETGTMKHVTELDTEKIGDKCTDECFRYKVHENFSYGKHKYTIMHCLKRIGDAGEQEKGKTEEVSDIPELLYLIGRSDDCQNTFIPVAAIEKGTLEKALDAAYTKAVKDHNDGIENYRKTQDEFQNLMKEKQEIIEECEIFLKTSKQRLEELQQMERNLKTKSHRTSQQDRDLLKKYNEEIEVVKENIAHWEALIEQAKQI